MTDLELYNKIIKLDNYNLLIEIENIELRLTCLLNLPSAQDNLDFLLAFYLKDAPDNIIINYLKYIKDNYYKCKVLGYLKDDNYKIEYIDLIDDIYNKTVLLKTIKNDEILMKYMDTHPEVLCYEIVNILSNDNDKVKYLKNIDAFDVAMILNKIYDEEILKKYVSYAGKYTSSILSRIYDSDFVYNYCMSENNLNLTLDVIKKSYDEELQKRLLLGIDDPIIKDIIASNDKKEEILSNVELPDIIYDVNENITIGLELETFNKKDYSKLANIITLLDNWEIKKDASVDDGIEIASPILRFNEKSLKELKFVCDFLNRNNFKIDDRCGGHIHLGFDYFKDHEDFDCFMKLYVSVEDVLYKISSRDETREDAFIFAKKMKEKVKVKINNINPSKFNDLYLYTNIIKEDIYDHYDGLNLENTFSEEKNTIEFRFPNGELDFNEIINNIRLFTRLFEVSKKENIDYVDVINESDNKLDNLLDLLFDTDEQKDVYKQRYSNNSK